MQKECTDCDLGTHAPRKGMESCLDCFGTYETEKGQAICKSCERGKFQEGIKKSNVKIVMEVHSQTPRARHIARIVRQDILVTRKV